MIEIRRATLEDLPIIQKLGQELLRYEQERWDDSLDLDWPYSGMGEKKYRNAIENRYTVIAFDGDVPAGYLIGTVQIPSAGDVRGIITANLNNIFVKEEMRRQGVGEMLMKDFRKYCLSNEVKKINVTVIAQNDSAIEFYKEQNFMPSRLIMTEDL